MFVTAVVFLLGHYFLLQGHGLDEIGRDTQPNYLQTMAA